MTRFYLGLIAELGYTQRKTTFLSSAERGKFKDGYYYNKWWEYDKPVNTQDAEVTISSMLNIGYRFRFEPFSLNAGAFGGLRIFSYNAIVRPLYILDISLGYEL